MHPEALIIHHSLSTDGPIGNWEFIRKFHVEDCGWDAIGYHFGTERVGSVYVNRIGRPETCVGAHTLGMNARSLGWCFVGNFDRSPPAMAMLITAAPPLALLCSTYNISVDRIEPHNKYADKSCPGLKFPMDTLRRFVSDALAEI